MPLERNQVQKFFAGWAYQVKEPKGITLTVFCPQIPAMAVDYQAFEDYGIPAFSGVSAIEPVSLLLMIEDGSDFPKYITHVFRGGAPLHVHLTYGIKITCLFVAATFTDRLWATICERRARETILFSRGVDALADNATPIVFDHILGNIYLPIASMGIPTPRETIGRLVALNLLVYQVIVGGGALVATLHFYPRILSAYTGLGGTAVINTAFVGNDQWSVNMQDSTIRGFAKANLYPGRFPQNDPGALGTSWGFGDWFRQAILYCPEYNAATLSVRCAFSGTHALEF